MNKITTLILSLLITLLLGYNNVYSQTNPTPFDLNSGNYSFTQWDATSTAGTYPNNMRFHTFSAADNSIANPAHVANADYTLAYNLTSGSIINGLGVDGIAFRNTGSPGNLGAAVTSISTVNRTNVRIGWSGATLASTFTSFRVYAINLEYRIGNTGSWTVATYTPGGTDSVQYIASLSSGNTNTVAQRLTVANFTLPVACENQSEVQVRWRYNYRSGSGNRPQLAIDDILIQSDPSTGVPIALGIPTISPSSPSALTNFSVTVQALNSLNQVRAVTSNTAITLSLFSGTGVLSGTLTGTILSGQNSTVVSGVLYSIPEGGVVIRATTTSGMQLTPGNSAPFSVLPRASALTVTPLPTNWYANTSIPTLTVTAIRADNSTDISYPGPITITKATGPGNVTGTLVQTPVSGVATFSAVQFDAPGTYTLTISGPNVTSVTSTSITILPQPTMTEILFPQFMVGANTATRVPTWALVRFDNLQPNTTYRYRTGADSTFNGNTPNGAGNNIHYNANIQNYNYDTNPSDNLIAGRHSLFTTGANETSRVVWLNLVATGNARFNEGRNMHWIVLFRDSVRGLDSRYVSTNTTSARLFGTASNNITGIVDTTSALQERSIVCLYDNVAGTGQPISTAIVQEDGTTITAAVNYYAVLDGVSGSWATVVPNSLPNGIRRVEQRSLLTGQIINSFVDADGVWATVDTRNPNRGFTPIGFQTPQIQAGLNITGSSYCTNTPTTITWTSRGVATMNILVSRDGGATFPVVVATGINAFTGSFIWNIPDSLAGAPNLRLRFVDSERSNVFSTTGQFAINSPARLVRSPQNTGVCLGADTFLEVQVAGSNLSFQWEKDGQLMPGTNSPRLNLRSVTYGTAGLYRCIINGGSGCPGVNSGFALVSVNEGVTVLNQPGRVVSGIGRTAELRVDASQTIGVSYQWFRTRPLRALIDNNRISGSRSAVLTIRNLQASDFEGYVCIITSPCGNTESLEGRIDEGLINVAIQGSRSICENGTLDLRANVNSTIGGTFTYQWKKDGTPIQGATNADYVLNNVQVTSAGSYTCTVVNSPSKLEVTSFPNVITVRKAPSITRDPSATTVCEDENATFAITSDITTNVQYQWYRGDVRINSASQPALIVNKATTLDTGLYYAIVVGDCGSDTSLSARLTIKAKTVITTQPRATLNLVDGATIILSVTAEGSGTLQYQWFRDGVELTGANSKLATLVISNITWRDRGSYTVRITGDCGSTTSTASLVSVATSVEEELANYGFSVEQNSPNPVSSITTVGFTLSTEEAVLISLTDAFGRELTTSSLGILGSGRHTHTINMKDVTSGTYFYSVTVGGKRITKQCIVVK
jgi:hypothetical protein